MVTILGPTASGKTAVAVNLAFNLMVKLFLPIQDRFTVK